jgi:hypothetical protein
MVSQLFCETPVRSRWRLARLDFKPRQKRQSDFGWTDRVVAMFEEQSVSGWY